MPGAVNRYRQSSEGNAAVQPRREREMLRRAVGTVVRELLYVAEALEQRLMLSGATEAAAKDKAVEFFNASSAVFVQNQGQWADDSIKYAFNGQGINIGFTDSGPVMDLFRAQEPESSAPAVVDPLADRRDSEPPQMDAARIRMSFDGAAAVSPVGVDRSATSFNYLVGDASQHRSNVPGYTAVEYRGLWDGIDLKTWCKRNGLKYEFHVAPGADWRQIRVSYEGIVGLSIAADGSLHVATALGEIVEDAPVLYQEIDGHRNQVSGRFVRVDGDTYGFEVTGDFDRSRELVIDPDLAWATYLGGSHNESGYGIAVDGWGNVFVTGETASSDWATVGAYDTTHNGNYDVFVAKLNATGSSLLYCTYLGGSGGDYGYGIVADSSGIVYVTGGTFSSGWATPGTYDSTYNGYSDIFVAKLSATGSNLLYCTYLGSGDYDGGYGIAVDSLGNAYVTGFTYSSGWATPGAYDGTFNGFNDIFVAKLNATGSTLLYCTYLGSGDYEYGYGIAVESSGAVYLTGYTCSSGWATPGAYDTTCNGGPADVFVAKLDATGSYLLYCTYLGGSNTDFGRGIAVDSLGNAYVTGDTTSSGWATPGAYNSTYNGNGDVFVAKLNATGSSLFYCSYLGGGSGDSGHSIATDGSGNAYVTGATYSSGWATAGAYDTTYNGDSDVFVAKLSASGSSLLYCTYLGGSGYDCGRGVAVDGSGNAYVTGYTTSSDWATAGAYDTTHNGTSFNDVFVAKLSGLAEPADVGDTLYFARVLGLLASGVSVNGSDLLGNGLFSVKDVDVFAFTITSSASVTCDVDAESLGSALDAYLRVFSSSGTQLGYSDDVDGRDPRLTLTLSPDTYYVGMSGYSNRFYNPAILNSGMVSSTGSYTLKISAASAPTTWTPTITASAIYDGDPDGAVFGRYLVGAVVPAVDNTFTAYVSPITGFTSSAVTFDANFNGIRDAGDFTDSTPGDGWNWTTNVSALSGDQTLKIWAQESGGTWSSPADFTIDTQAAPAWLDPQYGHVTFNSSTGSYHIERLFGYKVGLATPQSIPFIATDPDGNPTWTGAYAGVELAFVAGLDGRVGSVCKSAVLGLSVFNWPWEVRYPLPKSSGDINLNLSSLAAIERSNGGWFNIQEVNANRRMQKAQREGGYLSPAKPGEADWSLAMSYSNLQAVVADDLSLQLHATLNISPSVSADVTRKLWRLRFGTWYSPPFPPVMPVLNVAVTPSLSVGLSANASVTVDWNGSSLSYSGSSLTITPQIELAIAGEVQVLYGAASAGLKFGGTLGLELGASWSVAEGWKPVTELTLEAKLSAIYSLCYGLISGEYVIKQWPESSPAAPAASESATLPDAVFSDLASGPGGTATMLYVPVSAAGTATTIYARDRDAAGNWLSPVVISSSSGLKQSPQIRRLSDGRLVAVWVESTIPAANVPSMTVAQVMGSQEIMFSIRDVGGTWSTPQAVESNAVLDDTPFLASAATGAQAILVFRRNSSNDPNLAGASDLYFSRWNGTAWSTPALLANGSANYFQPTVTYLPGGQAVAAWVVDGGELGRKSTIAAASFDGSAWSAPTIVSGSSATLSRQWPKLASLSDGRALLFWVEHGSDGDALMMAQRSASGTWGVPETVLTGWDLIDNPRVSVDAANVVKVVFHGLGERNEIYAITRDFAGSSGWSGTKSVSGGGSHVWLPSADTGSVMAYYNTGDLFGTGGQAAPIVPNDSNLPAGLGGARVGELADLAVTGSALQVTTGPLAAGQATTIRATISNTGWSASTGTQARLYNGDPASGGLLLDTRTVPAIAVGASAQVDFNWTPAATGTYTLYLVVDDPGTITELREDNNKASLPVGVVSPPTLVLDPASDTGTVGDGWTSDTTPTFTGTTASGTSLAIFVDSQLIPLAQATVTGTTFTATLPPLTNGAHTVWAQAYDAAGHPSAFSAPVSVMIDAVVLPTPAVPLLDSASDTGLFNNDGITRTLRPTINATVKPLTTVRFFDGLTLLGQATSAADGTVSLLVGADLSQGAHAIKVVQVDEIGNASPMSVALSLIVDSLPPAAQSGNFVYAAAPDRVTVQFSEDVSAYLELADLVVQPLPGGTTIVPESVSFDGATNLATFAFASDLPNGDYRATLGAGAVADKAGNTLSAGLTLDFFALNGDANRDRTVGFDDLLLLAQNYNGTGRTWATADFTGDGKVDFDDLLLLAQNYNATLPALPLDELAAPAAEASPAGPEGAVATSTVLRTSTNVTTTPDIALSASVSNAVGDPAASAPDPAVILSVPAPTDAGITTVAPAAIPAQAIDPLTPRSTFASTTKVAPAAVARSRRNGATPPVLRAAAPAHRAPATGVPLPQRFTFGDKPIRRKDDLLG